MVTQFRSSEPAKLIQESQNIDKMKNQLNHYLTGFVCDILFNLLPNAEVSKNIS
ncbi:hypothetical protein CLV94_3347 [Flavobacterium endophyticum]|uniref:Uncharacterized protein n=1 Tax=Flavobacterium endophyticum TaxID=1540163 RepID=A0A495LXU7_9FLAO|nr:hypothetical protein CLV94_3347 [Flavobacterium endophyticum]